MASRRIFFDGDVEAAFAAAARVSIESDALSAFSLRLSYAKSMTAAKSYASTAALANAAPAGSPAAPADLPKIAAAPVNDATTHEPTPPAPTTDAAAPIASASQTIAGFTKEVLARLSAAGANGSATFSMRWKVEFLVSALSSTPKAPQAQSAVDALADSLAA